MGFLDFTKKKGSRVPANATFRLTQEGREKLQEFGGDPKSRILIALESRGTSDLDEICQTAGLNKGEAERYIPGMVKGGYIQYVSSHSDESEGSV